MADILTLDFHLLLERAYNYFFDKKEQDGSDKIKKGDIYLTEEANYGIPTSAGSANVDWRRRMYLGKQILGDSYITEKEYTDKVSRDIGDIEKGTQFGVLLKDTQGSVGQVLDKMLFPVYAPCYYAPGHNTTIPGYTKDSDFYFFVGDTIPTAQSTGKYVARIESMGGVSAGSKARIDAAHYSYDLYQTESDGTAKVLGNTTVTDYETKSGQDLPNSNGLLVNAKGNLFDGVGIHRIVYSVTSEAGNDPVVDSTGATCQVYANDTTTLLRNASLSTYLKDSIDGDGIKCIAEVPGINPTPYTYYISYPIFTDVVPGSTSATYNNGYGRVESFKAFNGEGIVIEMGPQDSSAYVEIPKGYTIESIYPENMGGSYDTVNIIDHLQQTTVEVNGRIISDIPYKVVSGRGDNLYNRYVFKDHCIGGPSKYLMHLTKA